MLIHLLTVAALIGPDADDWRLPTKRVVLCPLGRDDGAIEPITTEPERHSSAHIVLRRPRAAPTLLVGFTGPKLGDPERLDALDLPNAEMFKDTHEVRPHR